MSARILVVDDVDFNVKLLDTKLKQEYYQVLTASNGREAIEVAKANKPDLILMDVMMPEMNGFEATKIIKADPELTHIPIIIVTALNDQTDKVNGLKSGADDFLTKPINDKALMMRIKSLLRLKMMTDELSLRVQTSQQFGFTTIDLNKCNIIESANVLLLDDDQAVYEKIRERFTIEKINLFYKQHLTEIENGTDTTDYALIIISSLMIEEDGLRLCSVIRSIERLRHTPILLIVDESDEVSLAKGLEIGVNDTLTSPIEFNELIARCNTQIRRKNYQDQLRKSYYESLQQSVQDALTGLYNRRYFETHIRNMIDRSHHSRQMISLLILDIDHFKKINDTYGHMSGDAALRELANVLNKSLRLTDLCARYGGEEFVVILPAANLEIATTVAERLRYAVESAIIKIPSAPFEIKITISIGVSSINEEDSLDTLLARADKNLYKAKEGGRNKVVND
jgi:two-component system, cell cycle response regulator